MSGLATSLTPPEAEPPMIFSDLPSDLVKPLIAGEGPIQPMSMEPALSASISAGPALKTWVLIWVEPSSFWNMPSWRPTSGVPWVRLAK